MKEAFEKIKERLKSKYNSYYHTRIDYSEGLRDGYEGALEIVSEVEAEYGNGWITDRIPTKEECGDFRRNWFQTTVDANGLHTIPMQYEYTTSRGKEISRWLAYGRISPWEVIAWKPMDEPYKPEKGE